MAVWWRLGLDAGHADVHRTAARVAAVDALRAGWICLAAKEQSRFPLILTPLRSSTSRPYKTDWRPFIGVRLMVWLLRSRTIFRMKSLSVLSLIALARPSGPLMGTPSISTITSPALSPAFAAGESLRTWLISIPPS